MSGVEGEIVVGKDKFCELEEESSRGLGQTMLSSVLSKCRSVPLPYLFVCFLSFKVFLIIHSWIDLEFKKKN